MDNQNQELKEACHKIATVIILDTKSEEPDSVQSLAEQLYDVSLKELQYLNNLGSNPSIVINAVNYIEQVQALSPVKNGIQWFTNILLTLIEIACPISVPEGKAKEFLSDMKHGIESLQNEA